MSDHSFTSDESVIFIDADFDTIDHADMFDVCDYLPAEFEASCD